MANSANPGARELDNPTVEPISVRVREACRLTGIGRSKFYELVASGDIEVIKIGAMTLVPFENLREFVDRAHRPRRSSSGRCYAAAQRAASVAAPPASRERPSRIDQV